MKILVIAFTLLMFTNGCMQRLDRPAAPKEDMFLGIINKEQFKPRAFRKQYFDHTPGGNSSYDQGWQDGCQTATSVQGTGLSRLRGPKIDAHRLSTDQWYLRGYQDSTNYCTLAIDWETH